MQNIDLKATAKANALATFFFVTGVVLVIVGLVTIPPHISTNSKVLKHAKYIAAMISRSVYISVGVLISCLSAFKMNVVRKDR